MAKTKPVRWWRDDETRYATRGPQIVPAARSDVVEWVALSPVDPEIARAIDHLTAWCRAEMIRLCMVPAEILNPNTPSGYGYRHPYTV